jgi:hypothetical protein
MRVWAGAHACPIDGRVCAFTLETSTWQRWNAWYQVGPASWRGADWGKLRCRAELPYDDGDRLRVGGGPGRGLRDDRDRGRQRFDRERRRDERSQRRDDRVRRATYYRSCVVRREQLGRAGRRRTRGRLRPRDLRRAGFECGTTLDGCGNVIYCGTCPPAQACGGGCGANPNLCGGCCPKTCQDLGYNCGMAGDGCGGTIDCGMCPPGPCGSPICGGAGPRDFNRLRLPRSR